MIGGSSPATHARRPLHDVTVLVAILVMAVIVVAACDVRPPDRRQQVQRLTQHIRRMPGVVAASSDLASRIARGMVQVWLSVDVAEDITADQLAAITAGHLDELRRVDYSAHQTELDVHAGSNLFAVDSGTRPVTNTQQILGQASRWVALHREFPSATSHSAPQSATRRNHRPATPARQRAKHPAQTSATAAPAPSTSPTPPTTPTSRKP